MGAGPLFPIGSIFAFFGSPLDLGWGMGQPKTSAVAKSRLETAVKAMEEAVELRQAAEAENEALRRDIEMLDAERKELAASLSEARNRAAKLESSAEEVAGRLDRAIDTIKTLLRS